jgi:UDP-N-acetylmuramyl pentapeptide synthase
MLIGVGEKMQDAIAVARANGMPESRCFHMKNASVAARFLQDRIRSGDVVLIKGSQSMRMERAVKELMDEPLRASELLCRQGNGWE